jgi:Tfp pilus assembly protein PilP
MMRIISFLIIVFFISGISYAKSISDVETNTFKNLSEQGKKEWTNDPFEPTKPSLKSVTIEDVQLTGLVYNANEAYALIGGFMVKVGDMVGDYKVVEINKDNVTLRKLDDVRTIRLAGGGL